MECGALRNILVKLQVDNSEDTGTVWLTGSQRFGIAKSVAKSLALVAKDKSHKCE